MKYRPLGKSDIQISEIGIGCSGFWGNNQFSEKDAHKIIFEAFERGVNFFDTGHNYCNYQAEPRLGRAIKELLKNYDRSKLVVSTKAGTTIGATKIFGPKNVSYSNFDKDYISSCIDKAISNLQCDYLDIFQLHSLPLEEQREAGLIDRLLELKQQGKIKAIGVNTHTLDDMEFISQHPEIYDMVLIDYNALQIDREPIINKLYQAGIGVVAGTVLAQGHLVQGKIGSLRSMADAWYMARAYLKPASRELMKTSEAMRNELAKFDNMSSAQAAISFVLNNKNISSCVIGTTKIKNLIDIVEAVDKELSNQQIHKIRNSYAKALST